MTTSETEVDPRLTQMLANHGYIRMKDSETGAVFYRGADHVYCSGYWVFFVCNGNTRSFPLEYALKLGVQVMEKLCMVHPAAPTSIRTDREDTTNYEFPHMRAI